MTPAVPPAKDHPRGGPQKPYAPPVLLELGALTTTTLGPSLGTGESGNPTLFRS